MAIIFSYTNSMSKQKHDLLEMGERGIGEIVISGRHENISLITCKSRKLIDQLSPRDSQQQMQVLIDECKKSFDFVILDISRDPTHISSAALISADMTYQVWDESPSCYTNCTHFISYLLEMGTFPSKVLRVVINKRTGVKLPSKLFSSNSLSLVSTIPYSQSILSSSWSGKVIGEIASTKKVMALASEGINLLVNNILGTDVLNKMEELRVEQKKVLGNKRVGKLPKKSKKTEVWWMLTKSSVIANQQKHGVDNIDIQDINSQMLWNMQIQKQVQGVCYKKTEELPDYFNKSDYGRRSIDESLITDFVYEKTNVPVKGYYFREYAIQMT